MTTRLLATVASFTFILGFVTMGVIAHFSAPAPAVVVYEDGAGVQYIGDQEVRTFPDGTFVWDCSKMGDRSC
jgi:hypothetical protein